MPEYCSNCGYRFEAWDKGNCPLCNSAKRSEAISKPERSTKPYKITSGEKKGIGVGIGIVTILLFLVIIFNNTSNIPIQDVNEHLNDIEESVKDTSKNIQTDLEKKTDDISKSIESGSSGIIESLKPKLENPNTDPSKPETSFGKPEIIIFELEQKIHSLINIERQNQGFSPLAFDTTLTKIARMHSQDMAKRNYYEHESPEGKTFSDRYKEGKFNCEIPISQATTETASGTTIKTTYSFGAENIAKNSLYDSIEYLDGVPVWYDWNDVDDLASSTVQGWMNSAGHRENILTAYFQSEGIGIAISSEDRVYITQDFC